MGQQNGGLGWTGNEIVVLKCVVWTIDGLSVSAIHMNTGWETSARPLANASDNLAG